MAPFLFLCYITYDTILAYKKQKRNGEFIMKKLAFSILLTSVLLLPITAFAAGSFSSSYSFYGGVYSKSFNSSKGNGNYVTTTPKQWAQKSKINIYLQRKSGLVWVSGGDKSSWNYAYKRDTCSSIKSLNSGTHRFYLRAASLPNTTKEYKGDISVFYNN